MTPKLREHVRRRARDRCEYCQLPQSATVLSHEADHIRSSKHEGKTELENLCWACAQCNGHKQADVAGYVPGTDRIVRLFNPRSDVWSEHFEWRGALLLGKTDIGNTTIAVLAINRLERVQHRQLLMQLNAFFES